MIITKRKPFDEILGSIRGKNKLFLIGCSLCATTCRTGGEKDLDKIAVFLEENSKVIVGKAVLDPACSILEIKRFYRKHSGDIKRCDAVVSFACGGGTQAVSEILEDAEVCPGNDTLFQGEITRLTLQGGRFEQKCSLCGECILAETGSICPVTRCPKGLINGPCGGAKKGKCETDKDLDCIWLLIYDRLKKSGNVSKIKKIREPKDHSKKNKPESLDI